MRRWWSKAKNRRRAGDHFSPTAAIFLKDHIARSRGIAPHSQLPTREVKSTLLTQLEMYIPRQHYAPEIPKSPHQHRSPHIPPAADSTALRTVIVCTATICRSSVIDVGV